MPSGSFDFYPTNLIKLADISGVAVGSTALINCPKGWRYRRLNLMFQDTGSGSTAAPAIGTFTGANDIQMSIASSVFRRAQGTQIDLINTLNGSQYASYGIAGASNGGGITYLPAYFEEPWRKRSDFQNGLALETGWLSTNQAFQIKVPIASSGVTTPVLTAFAIVDAFSSGAQNPVMKWFPTDSNTSSASLVLSNITQGANANDMIESLSLLNTSDSKFVSQAQLLLNNQIVYDTITFDMQTAFLKQADMNPTGNSQSGANAYHIIFDHDDLFESLRLVSSITQSQLTATFSASSTGSMRIIMQRLGLPTV